ncbi:hypothetical protein M0802_011819 [Mischocyttarus mexicanus]|nr:hypothetical protein M0802_011819 [Mischocyttarus mexicanus]
MAFHSGQSFFQKHFLFSNRLVMLIMGLLPNQNSKNQLIVVSLIIFFATPLVVYETRLLFNNLKSDCERLSNKEELNIMKKYTKEIKLYSYCIILAFSLYYLAIVSPSTLNIILYLFGMLDENKLTLIIPVKDVPKAGMLYFILFIYQIFISTIVIIIGSVYYVTYLVFVQHACYQFSVIILKIRQLSKKQEEHLGTVLNRTIPWEERDWIVDIIKHYKQVLEYINLINNYSKIVYLIATGVAMIFVVFDFLYIFRMSEILQSTRETIESSLILAVSIILLYLNFYVGQKLLNHGSAIYDELRKAPFYMLSVKTQKLFLFIIRRSMKPTGLSIGGMFVSSNEVFASIMRTAFSYATMYYKFRLLLTQITQDCEQLSDEEETKIMDKYNKENKLYAYGIVVLFSIYVISITFSSIFKVLLYLFGKLDSNELTLPLAINNNSNAGVLFYCMLIYQTIGFYIVLIIGVVFFTTYLVIVQHACCQFSILIWKIKEMFNADEEGVSKTLQSEIKPMNEFTGIVDIILFQLSMVWQNLPKIIEFSVYLTGSLFAIYINFYIGQKLLNFSEAVFNEFCQIPFYLLSRTTQYLLIFIIRRSLKPCMLSIGGLYASSYETFSGASKYSLMIMNKFLEIFFSDIVCLIFQLMQKAFSFAMVYFNVK